MRIKTHIWSSLIILGLMVVSSSAALAQMPEHQNNHFQKIEQPLSWKIGVTLGGLGLIGLELWWFLFSKKK